MQEILVCVEKDGVKGGGVRKRRGGEMIAM